jgi:hypothetical protein
MAKPTSDIPPGAQTADLSELVGLVVKAQTEAASRGKLTLWTIYDHPKDFPDDIVARRHEVPGGPTERWMGGDLELLRDVFRGAGLVRVDRAPNDDVKIVESWI